MLDFIFRRGNPTNGWQQPLNLTLAAALDLPSLNGVALGSRLDQLSSIGRSDKSSLPGYLLFSDLGISIDHSDDGTFEGFSVVFRDEVEGIQPYGGTLLWKQKQITLNDLTLSNLPNLFGDWYWLDTDEEESVVFFEYPDYEMMMEVDLAGAVKRIIVTNEPCLADLDQRKAYNVDKPWPPQ